MNPVSTKKIAILGGGSWGTALAIILSRSRAPHRISLWVHDPAVCDALRSKRSNEIYLPGFPLASEIEITHQAAAALDGASIVVGAVPSAHTRAVYAEMLPQFTKDTAFVSATKGLEPETHARMSEVVFQVVSPKFLPRIAALSGPSFAVEAARGDPTAVVIASKDRDLAAKVQEEFSGPTFRLYTNDDILGVELGGAVKNVIALAAGICHGLGFGSNTLAALITRGLAEMTRLGTALGARPETLAGLAGMGDLVLTCTGGLSRNRSVGIELAKGRPLVEILAGMRMVAEGVGTTAATLELARAAHVEMPITEQVVAVLHAGRSPRDAIREIMERRLKQE
jgi:glycerol-3-phosphate dehydrogenase (NAD(P)+)